MSKKVCVPGLNIAVVLPDDWFISPRQIKLNPFALPGDVYAVGEIHLLSSALAIIDSEWIYFKEKVLSPEEILYNLHENPEILAKLNLRLLTKTEINLEGCFQAEKAYYDRVLQGYHMKLIEVHVVKKAVYKDVENFRAINISCSALDKEYSRYKPIFENILNSIDLTIESEIGLCFDIKKIDDCPRHYPTYAHYARDLFMQNINPKYLANSFLYWGDVLPACKYFCIKVVTTNPETCFHIREMFGQAAQIDELAPLSDRFLTGLDLAAQPLPFTGRFDQLGNFIQG